VSNITRNCQRSAETAVQHQPNLCQRSGDYGMSNVNRSTTPECGSPGNRTLNLRIKSPLLCLIELATRQQQSTHTLWGQRWSKGDRPDSNRRHPGPQPGALTMLSYGRHGFSSLAALAIRFTSRAMIAPRPSPGPTGMARVRRHPRVTTDRRPSVPGCYLRLRSWERASHGPHPSSS
jgi:hypothetical protein